MNWCWGNQVGSPILFSSYLPATARLLVDNQLTFSTTGTREFITPPLPRGQDFRYTPTAELPHKSKPVTVSQRITVRAGQNTAVSLQFPEARLTKK